MTFSTFELHPDIYSSIEALGYTEPTPIQKLAIPIVLEGGDVLARAQTGTGKTAAFTLPMLHRLSQNSHRGSKSPLALVLTPTRELAAQVAKSVSDYGKNLSLRSTVIFGGVGIRPQVKQLRQGVDIVIGTPGRLLDLATQKELDLSCIDILVFDEADRMLDMGFIHDIRKILRLVKKKRQTLFFSATYTKEIKALSDTILRDPKVVEVVSQNSATETVTQSVYFTPKAKKRNLLIHLISSNKWSQVLVFTKTKHGANRLTKDLNKAGIDSAAIHGNKSQGARTRALADFKENKLHVLVATDIAARGLDISELPYVVNFELPHVPEDYVHRIGRTGRAGYEGEAVSLVSQEEVKLLRAIERTMKAKVPVKHHDEFSEELSEEDPSFKKVGSKRPDRNRNSNKKKSGYSGNRTRDTESEKSNSSKKRYKGTGGNYSGNRTRDAESEKSDKSKKRYRGNNRTSSQNSSRPNSQRGQYSEK